MWRCVAEWEIFDVSENRNSFVFWGLSGAPLRIVWPRGWRNYDIWTVGDYASNATSSLLRRLESSRPQLWNSQTSFSARPHVTGNWKVSQATTRVYTPMRFVWMYIGYVMVHRDHLSINASCHTRRQTNKQRIKLIFKRMLQLHILLYMDVYGNETPRDEKKLRTIKNICWGRNIRIQTGIKSMAEITNSGALPRYRPRPLLSTAS